MITIKIPNPQKIKAKKDESLGKLIRKRKIPILNKKTAKRIEPIAGRK